MGLLSKEEPYSCLMESSLAGVSSVDSIAKDPRSRRGSTPTEYGQLERWTEGVASRERKESEPTTSSKQESCDASHQRPLLPSSPPACALQGPKSSSGKRWSAASRAIASTSRPGAGLR
jgi:hypothetical protein